MTITPLPESRFTKDGIWVVCTKIECGTRFAEILKVPIPQLEWGLDFLPGWACGKDGVWRMSRRAWKNLSRGQGPKVRRLPNPDGFTLLGSFKKHDQPIRERSERPGSVFHRMFSYLPATVICPACRTHQVVLGFARH